MRRIALLLAMAVLMAPVAAGAEARSVPAQPVTSFFPGERLHYVLKWAGIAAGDSVMAIEPSGPEGSKIFKVVSTATSRALVDVFYKVRNRYETHIDPATSLSQKYVFKQNEGGKRKARVLLFDQDAHRVTRIVREKGQTQRQDYDIRRDCQDNLSSLYAMRNVDLAVGDSLKFNVFEGKKNWELIVDVLAREEITVGAGTFDTFKVHPKLKFEGIFRRKGELYVWVTADRWHVPVLMKSKVKIGSVNAELYDLELGGDSPAAQGTAPPPVDEDGQGR